jgi:hypothetical protein
MITTGNTSKEKSKENTRLGALSIAGSIHV